MRKATHADAELLLKLYEIRREPELRRARQWLLTGFKPTSWAEIKSRYLSHSDEDRWFRMATSYWEMVGTLVANGVLHAEMLFDHTGEDIVTWERCKSWIADARADIRPTYLWRFEQLVVAHLAYRARTIAALARKPKVPAKRRKR
jgi:inorganic triphosphatase YgiF